MEDSKKYYVYSIKLVNQETNERIVKYIGKGTDPKKEKRWSNHKTKALHLLDENCKHKSPEECPYCFYDDGRIQKTYFLLHKKLAQYGIENFEYELIEIFDNEKDALDREKYWIEYYKTYVGHKSGGYNLTLGGEGTSGHYQRSGKNHPMYGKKHTKETKQKISKKISKIMTGENNPMKRPEVRAKFTGTNSPSYGKRRSEEAKKKMSEKRKGRYGGEKHPLSKLTNQQRKEIIELKNQDKTFREIAKLYHISPSQAGRVYKNKNKWLKL